MTRRLWILGPPALVIVGVMAFFRVVFTNEAGRRKMFPIMRPLYKHVFNPKSLRDAKRGELRWGVLHHVGRTSGRSYETPIDAQPMPGGMVIPLVYGPQADWCRNVLAAGNCTLTLDGNDIELIEPLVISWVEAEPQVSAGKARFWRSIGIEHLLSLKTAASAQAEVQTGRD
jgi:hypothetical protein